MGLSQLWIQAHRSLEQRFCHIQTATLRSHAVPEKRSPVAEQSLGAPRKPFRQTLQPRPYPFPLSYNHERRQRVPRDNRIRRGRIYLQSAQESIGRITVLTQSKLSQTQSYVLARRFGKFVRANAEHLDRRVKREMNKVFGAEIKIILLGVRVEVHSSPIVPHRFHVTPPIFFQ